MRTYGETTGSKEGAVTGTPNQRELYGEVTWEEDLLLLVVRVSQPRVTLQAGNKHPNLTLFPLAHLERQTEDNQQLFNLSGSYFSLICEIKVNNNTYLSEFL